MPNADKLIGYGPQGLALEVNPWQTRRSVDAVLLYRGAIVSAWANVETSLIEVAIRASRHSAYVGYRGHYPSKVKSRISYLRELLAQPGPLAPYRSLGEAVLDRYSESADLRNIMAHAGMTVLPNWGATFRFYQPKDHQEITYRRMRYLELELESLAARATRFSRASLMLVNRIDALKLLPPLHEA